MLRKHINSLPRECLDQLPFQSWHCLTLQLSNRDFDLVIPDERQVEMFLKFLVHRMRTLDGNKGSADKLLTVLEQQSIKEYKKSRNSNLVSVEKIADIRKHHE